MKPPRSYRGSGGERGRQDHHPRTPQGGEARGAGGRGERPHGAKPGAPRFGGKPGGKTPSGGRYGSGNHGEPSHGGSGHGGGPRERAQAPHQPRHGEHTLHARLPARTEEAPRHQREQRDQRGGERSGLWLYGIHAVVAALANPQRRLRRLLLTETAEEAIAVRLPRPWAITAERAEREQLDRLLGRDAVHQGAALHADPLVAPPLAQVLERPGPLVVLDQLADPRNVGAILRSAAALGAAAVIVQDRHAPEETGALAKAASGALETLPLLRAVNIARTLVALKAADVLVVGLDAAAAPLAGPALTGRRIAIVLGAEGEGLRRLTRETCDMLAGIAIQGGAQLDSLNVSAACAIALYELGRR
ncbi:MAG: RNA methyltransferase [Rhodospirillales bacterium]|nr:RNA methyltransferase [Rhodospirillales bacterium]